jgi:hypothetical protein
MNAVAPTKTNLAEMQKFQTEAGGALSNVFFRFSLHFFFDFHVSELVGVEYLTTIQTFDIFDVVFTRYDADFWVFAGGVH